LLFSLYRQDTLQNLHVLRKYVNTKKLSFLRQSAPKFDILTATIFVILRSHIYFRFPLFIQDVDFNCTQEIIDFHNVWFYIGSKRNEGFVACNDFTFTSLIKKFLPLNQMVFEARHKQACWWHN